jgi:DNA polymerase I-like protein with 3'-5' exonuclease and polymerase domains
MLASRGNFLNFTRGSRTGRRQLSTREEDLEFLTDPLANAVLQYRHNTKLLSTYIAPIAEDERFYTEYSLDTSVFRISSANRNIQNIPGSGAVINVREILIPDSGTFTTFDWSQMHLYILAHQSGDKQMQAVYEHPDPTKRDIHQHTADFLHITRKLAKTINYAIIYGGTVSTLMEQAKTRDHRLCQSLLDGWFRLYWQAADWIKSVQREGLRTGWSYPTIFDRSIRLPVESEDGMKRKAVNYPILGSDGEIMKRGLLLCCEKGLAPPVLAITVHDSATCDGDIEYPVEELENLAGFRIPLKVEKTSCWS